MYESKSVCVCVCEQHSSQLYRLCSSCTELGADIYDTGVTNITNIDTSMVVINQMVDANRDREEMECK